MNGAAVTVNGNITVEGKFAKGAFAYNDGLVTVNGNINATGEDGVGAWALSGGTITIHGDMQVYWGATAEGPGSKVTINGNVRTTGGGITTDDLQAALRASGGGKAIVNGDITATGEEAICVAAQSSGEVTVNGDVTATGTASVGAWAEGGGTATIDGAVIAPMYIRLSYWEGDDASEEYVTVDKAAGDGEPGTTPYEEYLIYSDTVNTVRVREACAIGGDLYATLDDALEAAGSGDTIRLLKDQSYSGIVISDKTITFDLNAHTLNVTNLTGHGLEVRDNGELRLSGNGALNVESRAPNKSGVYAHGGGKATVTSATAAGDNGVGAQAEGGEAIVMGNVTATGTGSVGVWASEGGAATIGGTISGSVYIKLGNLAKTIEEGEPGTGPNEGYRVYTDDLNTVKVGLYPVILIQPTDQAVKPGETATFTVAAAGRAPLTYRWKKGGVNLSNDDRISGATTATLTVRNVELSDVGTYSCYVEDQAGNGVSSQGATLTVDQSGFDVTLEPGQKVAGQQFALSISDAMGVGGNYLNGSINVTVQSNRVVGPIWAEPVSFADGAATVNLTLNRATSHTLTVSVAGVSVSKTVSVSVVHAETGRTWASVFPDVLPSGGGRTATITAWVGDEYGNRIPGEKVNFTHNGKGTLTNVSAFSDSNGAVETKYTSVAGDDGNIVLVTATVDGTDIKDTVGISVGTPLTVTGTDPSDGETDVPVDVDIMIEFNRTVLAGDHFSEITIEGTDVSTYSHSIDNNGGNFMLILDPTESLDYNTEYVVTIPAGAVKDDHGSPLPETYTFTFTTFPGIHPSGFDVEPAEAGPKTAGQPFTLNIWNVKAVDGTDLNARVNVTVTSDRVVGPVYDESVSFADGAATVDVTLNTADRHTLTVSVANVSETVSVQVVTREALAISGTSPSNNAANVPVTSNIMITFNKSVSESVYFSGITIEGDSVINYVYSFDDSHMNLTLDPTELLEHGEEYVVTIPAGAVEDSEGNGLAADYTFRFITSTAVDQPSGGGGSSSRTQTASLAAGNTRMALTTSVDRFAHSTTVTLGTSALDLAFAGVAADSDGVKTVTLEMPKVQSTKTYGVQMPAAALTADDLNRRLEIVSEIGSLTLPGNMLEGLGYEGTEKVGVSIGSADKAALPEDVREAVGDRPVVQLSMAVGGERLEWNNPDAPVTVSIPYTPTQEELEDPEHITVWYVDGAGNVHAVTSGRYDPETGTVTFTVTHSSHYAVVYVQKTFEDLDTVAWAKEQVEVLASKGILRGLTETEYGPSEPITRADYLYFLVRTLGVSARFEESFDDIPEDAYYFEEIGVAKKLGITNGVGDNKFDPASGITRQDMMVLTERALRMLGMLEEQGSAADLERFSDRSLIAPYAEGSVASLVKEGLIQGDGERLNPLGGTTRAEAAVFLYRVYNLR